MEEKRGKKDRKIIETWQPYEFFLYLFLMQSYTDYNYIKPLQQAQGVQVVDWRSENNRRLVVKDDDCNSKVSLTVIEVRQYLLIIFLRHYVDVIIRYSIESNKIRKCSEKKEK